MAAREAETVLAGQSALIEAFPETVALIDSAGTILAVNGSWRRFGSANAREGAYPGTGANYLEVCDNARGRDAEEAPSVADGIRAVLQGRASEFVLEYPCHTPARKNWFRLIVSPLHAAGFDAALVMHVDITEPKVTAERLLESQALLASASRVGRLGAWRLDYPGPILTWSDEVRAIHEVPLDFFPTVQDAIGFYAPEYRQQIRGTIRGCLEQGTPFDFKAIITTAKSRRRSVRVIGEAVRDDEGKISYLQGTIQDIDDNERTHAELKRASQRLASTLENMSDAFLLLDSQWCFRHMNAEAEKLLHCARGEVQGMSFWEKFPGTVDTEVHNKFFEAVERNTAVLFENFYPPLENWFEINAVPSPEGLAIYFRQITERKRAEAQLLQQAERLRVSELEYRMLFASNPQPMWVIGKDDFRFLAVNAAAVRHYGYSEEEFLSMTALDVRPPADVPRFLDQMQQPELPARTAVHQHRKKDGMIIEVEVTAGIVIFAGQPARIALIHDVTSRVQAEKEARRAQRLETVGTLAGGVAHDLNNLLSPISMGIGLLRETVEDTESLGALSTMESNTKRAAAVVRQLLSFARGTEGSRVLMKVQQVIAEVLVIATNTFPKNIAIESRVNQDVGATFADATQIHQVLLNLCLNARDAMPTGGKLSLRASRAEIDEHYAHMHSEILPGTYVLIEVTDTGTGIAPDVIERIFEPFYTTKDLGKGSGLGLSSSLGIVRSHNGFLCVASKVGKGSAFRVYLPAALGTLSEPPSVLTSLPRGREELILLVDDELPILEITSKALRAFGYKVLVAEDGARAVGLFAMHHQELAVILTDMTMPGTDGKDLITTLRRMNPTIPVIAASGHNAGDDAVAASEAGATDFLAKPYSAESLLKAIAGVLQPARGD